MNFSRAAVSVPAYRHSVDYCHSVSPLSIAYRQYLGPLMCGGCESEIFPCGSIWARLSPLSHRMRYERLETCVVYAIVLECYVDQPTSLCINRCNVHAVRIVQCASADFLACRISYLSESLHQNK